MSLTSAFFDAELVGGVYDRVYSAERFAEYFAAFIANGVFPDPATNLQVVANVPRDMTVLVKSGLGWINGYYCNNDGNYPLTISPASGTLPRVDAVVLRWSRSNRSISLEVKTGVATSSPSAPSLERSADNYELMLASIEVVAGATSIAQANITDKRPDSSVCGWVKGVVDQVDTTNLFAQYDDAFQTWFDNIQAQLSGDVATNLQNQINQRVKISDKASESEAKAGIDDTKWMTPKKVFDAIPWTGLKKPELLKTALSTTFTIPSGIKYIDLYIVGGGGGGGYGAWCSGGAGGYCKFFENLPVTPGQTMTITIGAGGAGSTSESTRGGTGGTTTVVINGETYSAAGGKGGIGNSGTGADGGSAGGESVSGSGVFYGAEKGRSTPAGVGGGSVDYTPVNPYNGRLYGCGGGGGDTNSWGYSIGGGDAGGDGSSSSTVDGGEGSGGGATKNGWDAGTGGIGGGGGAGNRYKSASGGPGICFVYGI